MRIPLEKQIHPIDPRAILSTLKEIIQEKGISHEDLGSAFELSISQHCGSIYGIAVDSRTSALCSILSTLSLKPGDQILCSAFVPAVYITTLIENNIRPIFCDNAPNSFEMNEIDFKSKLESGVKAVLFSHPYGIPCNIENVARECRKSNIAFIENVESGPGSLIRNKQIGTFGDVGILHFHPKKFLSLEDGCIVLTDHERIASCLKNSNSPTIHRMSHFQGALGLWSIDKNTEALERRTKIAKRYIRAFENIGCHFPFLSSKNQKYCFEYFPILLSQEKKVAIQFYLSAMNIETSVGKEPTNLNSYVEVTLRPESLPNAEIYHKNILLLPIYTTLGPIEQNRIIEIVRKELTT